MITALRSADVHDGMLDYAFAWGVRVCQHINQNVDGVTVECMRSVGGAVFQIHWMTRYESLAVYESVWAALAKDAGYQALVAEAREKGFLFGASIEDQIFQTVG